MAIIALTSDLMLSLQLQESGAKAGFVVSVASDPVALQQALQSGAARLIVIDLADPVFSLEQTITLVKGQTPRPAILAFYPHVRKDLAELAERAGCDLVLPRSRVLLNLAAALEGGLAATPAT